MRWVGGGRMRRLLADRDARLYLVGLFVSVFGDTALYLALAIWIRIQTGSTTAAGGVFVAFGLGFLVSPITGVWVDRVRRRPLLVWLNLATAVAVLAILVGDGRNLLWVVYLIMVGYGVATGTMRAARLALVRTIVPKELLAEAIGMIQVIGVLLSLVAPLLAAGLLVRFGPAPVIVLDAATFVVTATLIAALRVTEPEPDPVRHHWLTELTAGIRYLVGNPVLRRLAVLASLVTAAGGIQETTTFSLVAYGLHRSPAFVAVLATIECVGSLVSGLAAAWLMRAVGRSAPVRIGLAAATVGLLVQTSGVLAWAVVGALLIGGGMVLVATWYMTSFQETTPTEFIGRTDGALSALVSVSQTVCTAIGAALNGFVDYRVLLLAVASLVAAGLLNAPSSVSTSDTVAVDAG